MEDAETVSYRVNITYYLHHPLGDGKSSADLKAAVKAAVDKYTQWQSEKLGRDINPSTLIWLLMQTGIKRVEVTEPVFTALRDGGDGSAPQTAILTGVNIVDGGFEDE